MREHIRTCVTFSRTLVTVRVMKPNRAALVALRKAKYRFASHLARDAGISPGTLHDIETGRRNGTDRTLTSIAEALDVDLEAITIPEREGVMS